MKSFTKYILLIAVVMMVSTSCDDGFENLNVNPVTATSINPNFQFTWVQLRTSGGRYENWRAGLIYSSMMLQHMSALCGYWTGDKYTFNAGYASSLFDRAYPEQVKDMEDLLNTLRTSDAVGDPAMLSMARIWRVIIYHRLTDLYGDIPYSEAGQGFITGVDKPKYDTQESIYDDMLKELEEAVAGMGAEGGFGEADLIYAGDIDKWKRFGNSLMLRLAMRLSEVNPAKAQEWVGKAISGGVMNSSADNAFMEHTNGPEGVNRNGIGEVLDKSNGFGDDCPRLSATLVDWMLSTGDPRLNILGVVPEIGDGTHKGLPPGLDETTIKANLPDTTINHFSRINPDIVKVESPMVFMTYAETEFLLAEAALRGWHSGVAADHYDTGVRAAMKLYEIYDPSMTVDDADIDTYLSNNPFDGTQEAIGWQYWTATFLNEYESFANWRRTGFPNLTPVNYDGNVTNGTIPVRMAYPQSEIGVNGDNFEEARMRQGLPENFASMLTVPVWWDQ
ncbi:MAG: SusD/RagB family nutrient-binding outer membrane lipoprotein [Bacteroidota bacterium]